MYNTQRWVLQQQSSLKNVGMKVAGMRWWDAKEPGALKRTGQNIIKFIRFSMVMCCASVVIDKTRITLAVQLRCALASIQHLARCSAESSSSPLIIGVDCGVRVSPHHRQFQLFVDGSLIDDWISLFFFFWWGFVILLRWLLSCLFHLYSYNGRRVRWSCYMLIPGDRFLSVWDSHGAVYGRTGSSHQHFFPYTHSISIRVFHHKTLETRFTLDLLMDRHTRWKCRRI